MRAIGTPFAILLALAGCQCALYAQQDVITFTFNPPTPLSFTQTYKVTKVRVNGPAEIQTDVTDMKCKVRMTKVPKGYKVVATPTSVIMTRDGMPVPSNPIVDAFSKVVVTYDIDSAGKMLAVKGYHGAFKSMDKELKTVLSPQQYQSVSAALPGMEDGAIAKETAEWNARTASFVGRNAKIGDVWVGDETAETPFGTIVYDTTTKIAERVRKGNVDCVRIAFAYSTDAEGMKKFMQEMMDKLAESTGPDEAPAVVEVRVTGSGERVVDPKTLLIYSETINRTVTIITDHPQEGRQPLKIQEKREYTYQYGK